jgi:phosphoribosylanthranilate isomerase
VSLKLVKICGITRLEDAEAAVACGADALGFVFWPKSPRCIDSRRARAIVSALPPFVTPVGVFVDQPPEEINRIASAARLGAVQLHGNESLDSALSLDLPVLKAITVDSDAATVDAWPANILLLLDVHDPVRRGGTGQTVDWVAAGEIARRRRTILAGGLTPENVADAMARVRPYGIDVSSGVETSPGIKDHGRLKALFEAVHGSHYATRS